VLAAIDRPGWILVPLFARTLFVVIDHVAAGC
jgi:hypothetical protein